MDLTEKDIERFWKKVPLDLKDECWTWSDKQRPFGRGRINIQGKTFFAHRVAYEYAYFAWDGVKKRRNIPKGKYVLHTCGNPSCVNPEHLVLGDSKDKWTLRNEIKNTNNWKRCFHCRGFKRNDQGEFTDPKEVEADILRLFASGNYFPSELFDHFKVSEEQQKKIREKLTEKSIRSEKKEDNIPKRSKVANTGKKQSKKRSKPKTADRR